MSRALRQNPNLVLLLTGTNDMNPNPKTSKEGSDPKEAVGRLGSLIDAVNKKLPNAVILVALLPGQRATKQQADNTAEYNKLIPATIEARWEAGMKIAVVDMQSIKVSICSLHSELPQLNNFTG